MKRSSYTLRKKEINIMNRIVKISLISAASVIGTAVVSGISYVKGKKDGVMLTKKYYEAQLNATTTDKTSESRAHA